MERLVGRHHELCRLRQVLDSDSPQPTAVIVADAGLGKSSLLRAVRNSIKWRRVIDVTAPVDRLDPLAGFDSLLHALGAPGIGDDDSLTADERRWDVVDRLTESIAAAGPLMITFDDLHDADPVVLWIIEELRKSSAASRTALAIATRPTHRLDIESLLRSSTVLELEPLTHVEVVEMIERDGLDLEPQAVLAITGGSPLLISQLGRGGDPSAKGIDIVSARFRGLSLDTQEALRTLALSPFAPPAVRAAAVQRSAMDVDASLGPARRIGILDESDRFAHDLIREAVTSAMPTDDGKLLHAKLADAWQSLETLEADTEAARHRLGAIPAVAAGVAIDRAIEVASRLTTARRPDAALNLLELLEVAVERHTRSDRERRAARLIAEADARWSIGERMESVELGVVASELLSDSSEPVLRAHAEVAATRQHDTIVPDPQRLHRVIEVASGLAADDPLRARLLGRASVLALTALDLEAAHRFGDEGLEIAVGSGDIELQVQLLTDRYLGVVDRPEAEERERQARRIIGMAARARRSDLALVGHQWVAGGHVQRADLAAASDELDRLEILGALRPSNWEIIVAFRRLTIIGMTGPRDAALEMADVTWDRFAHQLGEQERLGVEYEYRAALVRLYGGTDPKVAELHDRLFATPLPPVPFIAIRGGSLPLMNGDLEAVDRVASRWAPRSKSVVRSFMGLPTMAILASMTAALGDRALCEHVVAALLPFSGLLATDNGIGVNPPVDTLLADNLVHIDLDLAIEHAKRGVDLAASSGAGPLVGRAKATLDDALGKRGKDAITAAQVVGGAPIGSDMEGRIRRDDDRWVFRASYGTATVHHTRGVEQLISLLIANGAEVAANTLAAPGGTIIPTGDLGPALDASAKRAYRRKITELEAEIEESRRFNDPAKAERAEIELDAIMAELRSALGLGGRDRPQRSGEERARVNVTRSIRRAIDAISADLPGLGAHLSVSVNTGRWCSYRPEPAARIEWRVEG